MNGHGSTTAIDGALVATCDFTTGRPVDPMNARRPYAAVIACPISLVEDTGTDLIAHFGPPTVQISGMEDVVNEVSCAEAMAKIQGGLNGHCSTTAVDAALVGMCDFTTEGPVDPRLL